MKRIYFVRHGETEANLGGYYQSPEVQLSQKGHQGAQALATRFAHLPVDVIFASPYVRAQQTASYITRLTSKPFFSCEYAHEVINAHTLWGKHYTSDEARLYEEERAHNFTNPTWRPSGAENYFDVSARVQKCIALLEESQYSNIVFVSHGNFLRFLIARLLLQKQDVTESNMAVYKSLNRMSNVGITEFECESGEWRLFTWNDYAHFAE